MWAVNGENLQMCEGDYGVELPITINGVTFTAQDEVLFTLKDKANGTTVFTKTFSNIQNNKIILEISEAESALLPVGVYVYTLDWYQDGAFLCNIIPSALIKVVDKA